MDDSAVTCAAAEPQLTRVLRVLGITLLILLSAVLVALTRPVIEQVHAITFLRLGAFVAALGMLASSVAAFWWRDASLRRVEWAAYLGIALLLVEQFAIGPSGLSSSPSRPVALVFGLLVVAIVLARVSRRKNTADCNCG